MFGLAAGRGHMHILIHMPRTTIHHATLRRIVFPIIKISHYFFFFFWFG
jgi:hypothetical protein